MESQSPKKAAKSLRRDDQKAKTEQKPKLEDMNYYDFGQVLKKKGFINDKVLEFNLDGYYRMILNKKTEKLRDE